MATEKIVLEGRSRRAIERLAHFGPRKIRLDESVDEATRKIVRAYARAWQVTQGEAKEMARYAAEARHDGGMSPRQIARLDRVDRGLHVLERQIRDLDKFAGVTISGAADRRTRHDVDAVVNSLAELTGLDRRFTKPSGAALEGLILRSTGRIEAATRRLDATQATALKDGLLRGLLLGENPRTTARHVLDQTQGAFFGGLNRATTIAATEIADAHRYANRLAYTESDLVTGWKWLAQLDSRTCPACWSMHNTSHTPDEMQFGHQRCRCTMVPVLVDDEPTDHDLGNPEEIFWNLPREDQLAIMGPGRLKALEAGVHWSNLTYLKPSTDWRPSQAVTRVSDLTGLGSLNVATFPGDVIEIPGQTNATIMSYAFEQGGLTVNALTGEQPTSGYVVARNGHSEVIDAREFFGPAGPTRMAAWLQRNADLLDEPGAHVGMWYDTANGKVVLDVVQILKDRDAAIALGRAEDQIAIFDLDTFTEINTGGTGGYADPISSALGQGDIGREATITREGPDEFTSGTVIAAGSWGVRIRTSDGTEINAAPGQFIFESARVQATMDRLKEIDKIEAHGYVETGLKVDYTRADVKSAKEMNDALVDLVKDWDGIKPTGLHVGTATTGGAFAVTTTNYRSGRATSDIEVNTDYAKSWSEWQSSMAEAEARMHFHRGTSDDPADYTVDHEFGHVAVMDLLGDPRLPDGFHRRTAIVADVYNTLYAEQIKSGDTYKATSDSIVQIWNTNPDFRKKVMGDLSGYALTSPDEFLAEGFAVFRDHGPGESIVADTVMKHLASAYLAQFGHLPDEPGLRELLGL